MMKKIWVIGIFFTLFISAVILFYHKEQPSPGIEIDYTVMAPPAILGTGTKAELDSLLTVQMTSGEVIKQLGRPYLTSFYSKNKSVFYYHLNDPYIYDDDLKSFVIGFYVEFVDEKVLSWGIITPNSSVNLIRYKM